MIRSLNSAASGLKTHQLGMDVIGNNISNVNTTAFKSTKVSFDNLLQQTLKPTNAANNTVNSVNSNQVGLGATAGAKRLRITADGASRTTDEPLDLRISDTGSTNFFVVMEGNQVHYTRDGRLNVDANGDLVMAATGYYVYGWPSTDGATINKTGPLQRIHIVDEEIKNSTYGEPTTYARIQGTLGSKDPSLYHNGTSVSIEMFDAKGLRYNATFSFMSNNADSANSYDMVLSGLKDENGNAIPTDGTRYSVIFDPDTNKVLSVNGVNGSNATVTMPAAFGVNNITVDLTGLKLKIQDDVKDYEIKGGLPEWVSIDAGMTPNSVDLGILSNNYAMADGNHVSTVLDFTNFAANKESLIGSGFYTTCCTCDNFYSIRFVDEEESTYEPTERHHIYNIGIKNINTAEELIQAIIAGTDNGNPQSHFTHFEGNGGMLTIYDDRPNVLPHKENDEGLFGRGVATGLKITNPTEMSALRGDANGSDAGLEQGYYTGYTIDTAGRVYIEYSNGGRKLNAWLGMAQFQNPMGLESNGNDVYDATLNSGAAQLDTIDARNGSIFSGQLEMSNVDLADEMTQMIIMQRAFQANSRIISTSDSMLELLSNLKR